MLQLVFQKDFRGIQGRKHTHVEGIEKQEENLQQM
jgi:hypothetical protein